MWAPRLLARRRRACHTHSPGNRAGGALDLSLLPLPRLLVPCNITMQCTAACCEGERRAFCNEFGKTCNVVSAATTDLHTPQLLPLCMAVWEKMRGMFPAAPHMWPPSGGRPSPPPIEKAAALPPPFPPQTAVEFASVSAGDIQHRRPPGNSWTPPSTAYPRPDTQRRLCGCGGPPWRKM